MLFVLLTAHAFDRVEESDTLAMGSASVAAPFSNSMIASNPGGLGISKRYHFSLGFGYGGRGIHWQVGAVDSQTSPVAFGVTYSGDRYHPPLKEHELPGWSVPDQPIQNRKRTHDVAVGLAVPLLEHRLSFGLGGSISFFDHDRQGKGFTGNLHAGGAVQPVEQLVIGLSARNLLPVDDPSLDRPLELLGGVWFGDREIGGLSIEGGARPEAITPLVLAAGGEFMPASVFVRGGWRYQDNLHNATMGIGGGTDAARVDLALGVPIPSIIKPLDWTVQLSIRFKGPDMSAIQDPR